MTVMLIKVCLLILQIPASFMFVPHSIEGHEESDFKLGADRHLPLLLPETHIAVSFGHHSPNFGAGKAKLPSTNNLHDKDVFRKRICKKLTLRRLTETEEFVNKYDVQDIKMRNLFFAEKHEKPDDEEEEEYEYEEPDNAETDLEKHLPGCGPPTDVQVKIVQRTAFQLSWLTRTPQVQPVKYFILEWEQAKKENEPVAKCRQSVDYESDKKNASFTHHTTTVEDLITDHKYQFKVTSVYNDYQMYSAPKTPWIYLPGDGQAPRVTHPPGFTPEPFPDHWLDPSSFDGVKKKTNSGFQDGSVTHNGHD